MVNINSRDLSFTEDGDFFFKRRNGLEESGYENNQLLIEKLILRIQSSSYDWGSFLPESANLDYFRGAPVNDSTLNQMQNARWDFYWYEISSIYDAKIATKAMKFRTMF